MRRVPVFLALPLFASLALAGGTVQVTEVGKQPVQANFSSGGSLELNLCSGGVELRGTDDEKIRVSYRSRKDTRQVKVRLTLSGNEGSLEVDNCPHDDFTMSIEVPRMAHLNVRMFAGQLDIENIQGDKDLELNFGQLNVEVGKPEDYAHVKASVTTGEVDGASFDVSKGGFFRSFETTGPGKYNLRAHVGAGQLLLR